MKLRTKGKEKKNLSRNKTWAFLNVLVSNRTDATEEQNSNTLIKYAVKVNQRILDTNFTSRNLYCRCAI